MQTETDDEIKTMFMEYFREHPEELVELQKRVEARAKKHQISEVGVAVFGLEGRIIREFEGISDRAGELPPAPTRITLATTAMEHCNAEQ